MTQKPEGESAFAKGLDEEPPRHEGRSLWDKAHDKTVASVKFSQSFATLRDMIKDAEIDITTLTKTERLGEGAFAIVDKCFYSTGDGMKRPVAVKRLKPQVFKDDLDLHDFVKESLLWKKLSHSNVVDFIGMGADVERVQDSSADISPECIFLVTEFMSRGTLYSMVVRQMKSKSCIYTKREGLQWLIHVAKGIKYLHNANPRVIHRDLKLENVLLTEERDGQLKAKIGDFGLHALIPAKGLGGHTPSSKAVLKQTSKLFNQQAKSIKKGKKPYAEEVFRLSGKTGSLMYMAPEVLKSAPYNEKADVFSFGIVMYEVLQKCMLLAFVSLRGIPAEVDQYIESVLSGFRPFIPKDWPPEIGFLLRRCWSDRIEDRPSMDSVVDALLDVQQKGLLADEKKSEQPRCFCCAQQ